MSPLLFPHRPPWCPQTLNPRESRDIFTSPNHKCREEKSRNLLCGSYIRKIAVQMAPLAIRATHIYACIYVYTSVSAHTALPVKSGSHTHDPRQRWCVSQGRRAVRTHARVHAHMYTYVPHVFGTSLASNVISVTTVRPTNCSARYSSL